MDRSPEPLVAVIIPLYNKREFVARAIDSVRAQRLGHWELVVVDDGSTDGSAEVAQAFIDAKRDSRIRLVRQANAGPGAARNTGVGASMAPLVSFLDADDEWEDNFLSDGVAALSAEAADAVAWSSGYREYPGAISTDHVWQQRGLREGIAVLLPDDQVDRLLALVAFMTPCSTIIRRDAFLRHGGFFSADRCRYAEDAFLWLRVLLRDPVFFSLLPRVRVHRDASQLSGNLTNARPLEPFLVFPELVRDACPVALRALLEDFLVLRAFKTACVWSYWGKWREGADLRRRFRRPGDRRIPLYFISMLCSTPLGPVAGAAHRTVVMSVRRTQRFIDTVFRRR